MYGILTVWGGLAAVIPGPDALVDYSVAEVDGTVVTRSELEAEARLALLRGYDNEVAKTADLTPELLAALLEAVVHRKILLAELRRLQLERVPAVALDKARAALRARFVRPEDYGAFWVDVGLARDSGGAGGKAPPALEAILREEIAVDRFLDMRIRAAIVLDDRDVARCFEANAGAFEGKPPDQVRRQIRARLRESQEEAALDRLLRQLKGRTDVRFPTSLKPATGERRPPPFTCPSRGL